MLWKKVMPRLSAGRVQSVATRMIVERERARMRFRSATWWDLDGTFAARAADRGRSGATLVAVGGTPVATGRDFADDRRASTRRRRRGPRRGRGHRPGRGPGRPALHRARR